MNAKPTGITKSSKKMGKESFTGSNPVGKAESVKEKKISIAKYFQLYGSGIHIYARAYLEVQFRDILKEKELWKQEINKIMEGDK